MIGTVNTKNIYYQVMEKFPRHLKEHPDVLRSVQDRCEAYSKQEYQIQGSNPFKDRLVVLEKYEANANVANLDIELSTLEEAVSEFFKLEEVAQISANKEYWSERISNIKNKKKWEENSKFKVSRKGKQDDDINLLYRKLMQDWREALDGAVLKWELDEIQRLKSAFMQEIEEWLEYLKQILKLIDGLGMELGYFLDFSEGQMSLSDMETLKKWLKIIENDQGIKEICEILGRIKQIGHSTEIERTESIEIQNRWIPDSDSKEEIVGIKIGNEIEHETDILFDLKFVESQLMCFDMMGYDNIDESKSIYRDENVKAEEPKGPIILCIDTSGSMHGPPEYVAKAITLHMVNLAFIKHSFFGFTRLPAEILPRWH